MNSINGKKAQVTAFVILGIIIVALVFTGYHYRNAIISKIKSEVPKAGFGDKAGDVKDYVESCIIKLADDAIDSIGMHGGYINIPANDVQVNLANPMQNRLTILPGLETAYWFYDKGNGVQNLNIPTIMDMQNEIAAYIDDNLIICTGNFKDFFGDVVYKKSKTAVEIRENDVAITMRFPITVSRNETIAKLEKFSANVVKPLGSLYNDAKQIMDKETKSNFLEEKTMDMFVVYEQIPYAGIDFDCSQKTWQKLNAFRNIKNIASNNMQYLKIKGTNYVLNDESHKYYEISALSNDDEKLDVNFMFSEEWPMLIDVLPDDAVMKSQPFASSSANKFVSQFFCLNYYNFVYSLRYPVLISLAKDDYIFQFATQVIIEQNQPKKNTVDVSYLEGKRARVCENPLAKIKVNVLGFDGDGRLHELNDARVSFKCLGVLCEIGRGNENLVFPQCLNGLIIAEKEGYNTNEIMATTNSEQEISINLEPIYEKNLTVLITREDGGDRSILSSEMILLQFEDKEQDYVASAIYPLDKKVKLVSGNYNARITIISNLTMPLQLKEEKIKSCNNVPRNGLLGLMGMTEKKCIESIIPSVTLNQVISGGEEFEFGLSRKELEISRGIVVYAIKNKMPETVNDIPKILEQMAKNKDNPNFKLPVLK